VASLGELCQQCTAHPMMPPLLSCDTQMLRSAAPLVRVRFCMSTLLALKMSRGYLMHQSHQAKFMHVFVAALEESLPLYFPP
jgi:hypothetical protein